MRGAAPSDAPTRLQRPEGLRLLDRAFPNEPIVLTIGGTIREMVAVCGRRANHLPMLDSMGLATPIGLGLAVGLADEPAIERVVVADGDGSLLMGFSVLTSIGLLRPKKLVVVLFDNGVYLATGGQATASATTDFVAAARACGLRSALVEGAAALEAALQTARTEDGPWLLRVPVGTEAPPTPFFNADPVVVRADFDRWLVARRA